MENHEDIRGQRVALRPATIDHMRPIYEWLAQSDVTPTMVGPPVFSEKPVPSWDEFLSDYAVHFFDGPATERGRCFVILVDGEPVGQVNYNDIEERKGRRRVELDIWMRAERFCGMGYGTDALDTVCHLLTGRFDVQEFMVQPSARNPRAVRVYEKAGFKRLDLRLSKAQESWGPRDYFDSVIMVMAIPSEL